MDVQKTETENPEAGTGSKESGSKKNKNHRKNSLIMQFSIKLGLFVLCLFIVLAELSIRSVSKETRKSYTATIKGMLPVFADTVNLWNQQFIHEMHMYTKSPIVKNGSKQEIATWLRSIKNQRVKDFSSVFFCSQDGIARSDQGQDIDVSDRDFFKNAIKQENDIYVGNPLLSRLDNTLIFHICVSAYNSQNIKIGFFAGVVTLNHFQKVVEQVKIGQQGYLSIMDGNGICIAHPDKKFIMKDMSTSKDPETAAIVKRMKQRESGEGRILNEKNEVSNAFFAPIKETPWSTIIVIPESQVNQTAIQLGKSIAVECIIFGVLLILSAGLMILRALRPLKSVETAIHTIASGNADLTQRIKETVNNEIGSVVIGFNRFVAKLQTIIGDVKESKSELATSGGDLQASIEDTSSAITQILSDIDGVNSEITNQSASVEETAGAVTEISQNIVSLEKMIENQASGITESSAAVEQMIGNIGSVNQSVDKMVLSFKGLEDSAKNGIAKLEHVSEQIELISGQSETLEGANTAIASIAGQTNLLAMNAAIEAAHAGDSGKGFSVVADEIRKLSETSSIQSKTIGEELKKIKNSITTVVTESSETSKAFIAVSGKIEETDMIISQIKSAMEEQFDGSKQISEALHMMNDSTTEVRTASSEMSSGQKAILEEVKRLQDATTSMKDKVGEMSQGARKINETGKALSGISKNVKKSIDRIGSQIDKFKV